MSARDAGLLPGLGTPDIWRQISIPSHKIHLKDSKWEREAGEVTKDWL